MPVVWFGVLGFVFLALAEQLIRGMTWLELVLMYSCCGAAKFCFVLTSGMSLESVVFAQCSLLCTQKWIASLPSKCVLLWSRSDYRGIAGNG